MGYQYSFGDREISQIEDYNDLYFDDDLYDQCNQIDSLDSFVNFELSKIFDEKGKKEKLLNDFFSLKNGSKKSSSNNSKKSNINGNKKYSKKKIDLSQKEQNFKNDFFLIFTNRKKFPKTIIKQIHSIIQGPLNLKPMTRDIVRCNDKYFIEYSNDAFKIIQYLVLHKNEIIESIPDLKNY